MAPVLYSTIANLKQALDGTDAGSGTAAQLTDPQLTLALQAGSSRVSVYAGAIYDSSSSALIPPDIFEPLTLDLSAFWATRTYMKHKEIGTTHPVWLAYSEAMKVLHDVRDGKIRLNPGVGGGSPSGHVINRIPVIFTPEDSNTQINPATGILEAATPSDMWSPRYNDWNDWGSLYQG
jgi:hypothetical protein